MLKRLVLNRMFDLGFFFKLFLFCFSAFKFHALILAKKNRLVITRTKKLRQKGMPCKLL